MSHYLGFSTFNGTKKGFGLVGRDLVVRDLLNHIYTLRGERVMMPAFGTRIPLMAFEPLDEMTLDAVEEDLKQVFDYDKRVELIDIVVMALPDHNAILAVCDLRFVELGGMVETLRLEFPTAS